MFSFVKSFMLFCLLLLTINSYPTFAQESESRQAQLTSADSQISLDTLDIIMAPLTVEELKIEADGWLKLIKASAHKVADAKLRIKSLSQKKDAAENTEVSTEKASAMEK